MDTRTVIDFHAHLAAGDDARDRLLCSMDKYGIDRCVVVAAGVVSPDELSRQLTDGGHVERDADNEAVLESCRRSHGRLVPFYFANPWAPADRYRRRAADFAGLKLAPGIHGMAFDDPRMRALSRIAAEFGHPVYLHCVGHPGRTVADLAAWATDVPAVTFVLGHAGVTHLDWYAVDLVASVPNGVYLAMVTGQAAARTADEVLSNPDRESVACRRYENFYKTGYDTYARLVQAFYDCDFDFNRYVASLPGTIERRWIARLVSGDFWSGANPLNGLLRDNRAWDLFAPFEPVYGCPVYPALDQSEYDMISA